MAEWFTGLQGLPLPIGIIVATGGVIYIILKRILDPMRNSIENTMRDTSRCMKEAVREQARATEVLINNHLAHEREQRGEMTQVMTETTRTLGSLCEENRRLAEVVLRVCGVANRDIN